MDYPHSYIHTHIHRNIPAYSYIIQLSRCEWPPRKRIRVKNSVVTSTMNAQNLLTVKINIKSCLISYYTNTCIYT